MIESKLLRKEPCLDCKSKGWDFDGNGLGVYDDGHTFCFKCKKYNITKKDNVYSSVDIESWKKNYMTPQNEFIEILQGEFRGLDSFKLSNIGIYIGECNNKKALLYDYTSGKKVYFYEEKPKKFAWIEGSERECGFFALDKFNDFTKPIIITEGELDAASCSQEGYQACSIKSGNQSLRQCLAIDGEKILQFKEIWLAFDNDEAGQVPLNHALEDLPKDKIKIVNFGKHKDANEALQAGDLEQILKDSVEPWKPEGIVFGNEIEWDEIWTSRPEGLKLPWDGLQSMIKGLHKGRLYLFGGGASIGKSSVLRELTYFLRTENPELKIAHLFLEEDYEAGPLTYLSLHENIPLGDLLENKDLIPKERRKELQELLNHNTVFTNEQYELGSEELLKQLDWLATVKKYDIIILDHISMVAEASDSKESERVCINKLMLKLRSLIRKTGLTVIAACHLSNPDMGKDWEDGREVKQKDFHGSSALRKVPDVMIGVERNMRNPYECDKVNLRVIKNRWFSKVGISDELVYITSTGRLK